jgi:hypothetical protein
MEELAARISRSHTSNSGRAQRSTAGVLPVDFTQGILGTGSSNEVDCIEALAFESMSILQAALQVSFTTTKLLYIHTSLVQLTDYCTAA